MGKSDNEIVAEFMGIRVRYQGPVLYHCDEDGYIDFIDGADTYSPNTNWSDLMPVVATINTMYAEDVFFNFDHDIYLSMRNWVSDVVIENAFADIVTMIKWYNTKRIIG